MSANRNQRIDRETAARLLDGHSGNPADRADPLAVLLAATAAPARDGELTGEQAALTAFRHAYPTTADLPRRGPMIKSALAKVLTTKAAVLAATATTVLGGGVVAAAATGNLPTGSHGGAAHGADSHTANPAGSHGPSDRPTSAGTNGSADPSPSMFGLCHAYTAGVADSNGKALDNPAFSVLISKAGGRDNVATYCKGVIAAGPGNAPTAHPTGQSGEHGQPTAHPTGASGDHPTGAPTAHPTGEPTAHPTGAPDDHGSPTAHPTH